MTTAGPAAEFSEQQGATAQLLTQVLGASFADRYLDACRLASGTLPLRVSRPLAAHAMREFESSLRDVLTIHRENGAKPAAIAKRSLKSLSAALKELGFDAGAIQRVRKAVEPRQNQRTQILKILAWLRFPENDQVGQAWLALTSLSESAHKRSFHQVLSVDEDFRIGLYEPFQLVVHEVASALKHRYSALMLRVKSLTDMSNKTAAVSLFKGEIPGAPPLQWHFFELLYDPAWLAPLAKARLLDPPGEYAVSTFPFGPWPAGRYLLRMAGSEDATVRRQVVDALHQPGMFRGLGTQAVVFDILVTLPPDEAAPFAPTVASWLDQRARNMPMHVLQRLALRLAEYGETAAAQTVTRSLLQVFDDKGSIDSLFTRGMYEYCLPTLVSALTASCGIVALELFIDLLRQASIVSGKLDEISGVDRTAYTGRSVADDEFSAYDIYSALIRGVRTSAETLIEDSPSSTRAVINKLSAASISICKRIAMHVLAKNPSCATELAETWLADVDLLEDTTCNLEYSALALAWYPSLSAERQESIIGLIRGIPERYRGVWKKRREQSGQSVSLDDEVAFDALTVMEVAWKWQAVLPASFQEELGATRQQYGIPGAWKRSTIDASEESPLLAADFSAKLASEIVGLLTTAPSHDEYTRGGTEALGHQWRLAVQLQPGRYASEADRFAGIYPVFLEHLLDGLTNAARNGTALTWGPVLTLANGILNRAIENGATSKIECSIDSEWLPVCRSVCDLLKAGLLQNAAAIEFRWAATLEALVLLLLDLRPELPEITDPTEQLAHDAFLAARETLQGSGLELAMWWLSWNARDSSSPIAMKPKEALTSSSHLAQKIQAQITGDLPTTYISRAVLGRYLGWINHFGPAWTAEHFDKLFDTTNNELRQTAWSGYILHSGYPVGSLYPRLRDLYDRDLCQVPADRPDNDNAAYRTIQLGNHLLALYMDGVVDLSAPVLQHFLQQTSPQQRRRVILSLDQYVRTDPDRVSEAKRSRGLALWEARLRAASATDDHSAFADEIEAFGHWIGNPQLEPPWVLTQLFTMLSANFMPSVAYSVVDWIASICDDNLERSVQIVMMLIEHHDAKPDLYMTQRNAIRKILVKALASGISTTVDTADRIISVLAIKGENEYLDLVPSKK